MATALVQKLDPSKAVEQLEGVAKSRTWTPFQLPSGAKILVAPDDSFETLRSVMRNPLFMESLEMAEKDVKEGKIQEFDDDFFEKNDFDKGK